MTNCGLAYLKAVKDAFTDDKEKYDKFLKLIKNFTAERFNVARGIEDVKELLKGHIYLIFGFNFFLPMGYEIKLPLEEEQPLQKKQDAIVEANKLLRKIETRFQDHDQVYKSFLAILKMHRDGNKTIATAYKEITELLQDHSDLLNELSGLSHISVTDPICFAHAQNFLFHEKSSAVPTEQQMCVPKRKRTKVSDDDHDHSIDDRLKRDWNEVVKEYSYYHQDGSEEFVFSAKVKDKLQNSKYGGIYSKEKITEQKLQSSATDLLGKYPHLMNGFKECVTQCEKMNDSLWDDEHGLIRLKEENLDKDQHYDSNNRVKKISECLERVKSTAVANNNVSGPKLSRYASKKYSEKPVEELDLSCCEQCTPSYHLLPEKFRVPSSSQRTELDAEVLNDHWKCANSSINGYSSKHISKNPYEMILFKCEDDRFELDMLLATAKSTTSRVEELIGKINDNIIERDRPINIETHLTAQNRRCIEQIYGDTGLDVLHMVEKNAPRVLQVVLTRLKQKQEEWERCRVDFNKIWAEVYAQNYHKSLNHLASARIQKP